MKSARTFHLALLFIVGIVFCWSGWRPYDRFTWWLETAPALAGIIILRRDLSPFPVDQFVLHADRPAHLCPFPGRALHLRARPGFSTGSVRSSAGSAITTTGSVISCRDLSRRSSRARFIIRLKVVSRKKWIPFFVVSVCLAISAFYELLEWWAALIGGSAADDFLGSQGDVWDTQSDMCLALIGAVCALLLLSRFHDRGLRAIQAPEDRPNEKIPHRLQSRAAKHVRLPLELFSARRLRIDSARGHRLPLARDF